MVIYFISWFVLGLIFLISSTSKFIKFAKILARRLHVSPLIIGVTVVALGTSLPELAVSLIAAVKGDYGLSVGNIVGSNISNVLLVFPVAILIGKLRIGTTKTQKSAVIVLVSALIYFALHFFNIPSWLTPYTLITIAAWVTYSHYRWGMYGAKNEDKLHVELNSDLGKFSIKEIGSALWGLLGIALGGYLIVLAVESLSNFYHLSTTILGLSLTALATSTPELVTTVFAQNDNEEKMAIGNILGSNIYNILFIGGLSSLFHSKIEFPVLDWAWFIGVSLFTVFLVKVFSGKVVPKGWAVLMIGLFLTYLTSLYL